ncbi:MAG: hypothetical protein GY804_09680 [Alphaproteobacteria bacterium]|nr:hypothetical protein [Alphaproteobacteria bacterium]
MKIDKLTDELNSMYQYCTSRYSKDSGDELAERITELNIYLARSASMLSWAQFYYDKAQGEESEAILKEEKDTGLRIAPTIFKQLVNGRTVNEAKILKFCERLNRTITHQIDGVRSQLSYLKQLRD